MSFSPYDKSRILNYAIWANSQREAEVAKLQAEYAVNMPNSLEYIPDAIINGHTQQVIAKKAKGSQRYSIQSYPGETFHAGDIVQCYGSTWIIIEVEANKDIYTTGTMLRCNHLFRFQNNTPEIVERWGVLDTGVYSTTVKETELDTQLNKQYKIYLPLDDQTRMLYVGKRIATGTMKNSKYEDVLTVWRTTEFDDSSENYGEDKLLVLKCISDQYNPRVDNIAERICDYIAPSSTPEPIVHNARITHSGEAITRIGGTGKTFRVEYDDAPEGVITTWLLGFNAPRGVQIRDNGDGSCKVVADEDVPDAALFELRAQGRLGDYAADASIVVEAVIS